MDWSLFVRLFRLGLSCSAATVVSIRTRRRERNGGSGGVEGGGLGVDEEGAGVVLVRVHLPVALHREAAGGERRGLPPCQVHTDHETRELWEVVSPRSLRIRGCTH